MTKEEVIKLIDPEHSQFVVNETNIPVVMLAENQFDKLLDAFMLVQKQRDAGEFEPCGLHETWVDVCDAEVRALLTKEGAE